MNKVLEIIKDIPNRFVNNLITSKTNCPTVLVYVVAIYIFATMYILGGIVTQRFLTGLLILSVIETVLYTYQSYRGMSIKIAG